MTQFDRGAGMLPALDRQVACLAGLRPAGTGTSTGPHFENVQAPHVDHGSTRQAAGPRHDYLAKRSRPPSKLLV